MVESSGNTSCRPSDKTLNKRSFGGYGERVAAEFLKKNGFSIIECNYRYGRLGEIDIISFENEYICFVEVKTRSSVLFGMPSESVTRRKQEKIRRLAEVYLKQHAYKSKFPRFDIVEIFTRRLPDDNGYEVKEVNLIRNAF
jgi:putative endonuclease